MCYSFLENEPLWYRGDPIAANMSFVFYDDFVGRGFRWTDGWGICYDLLGVQALETA
jgi:hypothetical protein